MAWSAQLAHPGKRPARGGAGRRLAGGVDCPAGVPPQDAQGVLSGGVLADRVAAPGVLD
eukprot:gene15732-18971_t